ncbi:uncharacterized protein LOC118189756, partial [Stegodyphus dumicola]|uniref:uncharacterized protein LOC118189756 n=1 Tax=Stegodyphus dumicola TaxID=202533 RepID=UPI0015B19A20
MAKVMDQPLSEEASSDNEEINKLFPRCRPRSVVSSSDFNQNNVNVNNNLKDHRKLSTASSDSTMSSSIMDKANDNYLPHNNQDHQDTLGRPASDMSETSSCCGGEQQQQPLPPPPAAEVTEDHSVISAYDYCDYDSGLLCNASTSNKEEARSNSTSSMTCDRRDFSEDVVYDPELDVGYHMDAGFCLRESRIEIAGGREIFSKSRSKPSKKRHSEEVTYHRQRVSADHSQTSCNNSSKSQDFKRFSADVMYDDKLRRYMYNMCSGSIDKLHTCAKYRTESSFIVEEKSPEHMPRLNGRMCLRKSSSVRGLQDLPIDSKQHSGHLVYEAPVSNAEIVYDDIGELIDQRKVENGAPGSSYGGNNTSNGLRVKTTSCDSEYSTYPGEILESPNSDTEQSFRIMHKLHIGALDVSSPISPSCGGLWGVDGLVQEHVGSLPNLSQEEEMDTDSEPASPVKQGIARLIGNVPIAEYEGSPRRYGPRPGYPHRVSSDCSTVEQNGDEKSHPSTCEELLKVIAGNKPIANDVRKNAQCKNSDDSVECSNHDSDVKSILKEFSSSNHCKNDSRDSSKGIANAQDSDFSELEYRLYRVNTGSSYVGRRLAQSSGGDNQDSPKRNDVVKLVNGDLPHVCKTTMATSDCLSPSRDSVPPPPSADDDAVNSSAGTASAVFLPNEQELMLLHESVHQHTLQVEMVDQDLESISTYPGTEDLGETEVGEQVDHTRNFTLSPETTDCDSNDVESVVSLEGSMNSGGRLMSSMPVLEDGLSSGHSSEPDTSEDEGSDGVWSENRKRSSEEFDNPTLALINKQISKIEQDFCKRPPSNNIVPPEKMNHQDVAEYLWRHSCNSQHLALQDVDLSYFDVLTPKPNESSPRLQNDTGLPEDCPNGKQGSANVSEAIKEIKQAIQMSKNVQLKSTHSGSNCEGPNQPVWVPRLSQSGKGKDGCHPDAHGERNVDDGG